MRILDPAIAMIRLVNRVSRYVTSEIHGGTAVDSEPSVFECFPFGSVVSEWRCSEYSPARPLSSPGKFFRVIKPAI